mmetsp:Transcript_27501/g.27162  ORF Transcript_27501/g.27162 Transcript_27501/m.27162 type:complete len:216 (+) Transcript_27501:1241-1888(+)
MNLLCRFWRLVDMFGSFLRLIMRNDFRRILMLGMVMRLFRLFSCKRSLYFFFSWIFKLYYLLFLSYLLRFLNNINFMMLFFVDLLSWFLRCFLLEFYYMHNNFRFRFRSLLYRLFFFFLFNLLFFGFFYWSFLLQWFRLSNASCLRKRLFAVSCFLRCFRSIKIFTNKIHELFSVANSFYLVKGKFFRSFEDFWLFFDFCFFLEFYLRHISEYLA